MTDRFAAVSKALAAALLSAAFAAGCASIMSSATSGMAANLNAAILDQDDPETVRDGAPAYLLMLDSFVRGSPDDPAMLGAAAELYAAYGIVFVDDPERARRLTARSRNYGRRSLCAAKRATCDLWDRPYEEFVRGLDETSAADTQALYTAGLTWLAYIRAHRDDWSALAELPYAEAVLLRVRALDESFRPGDVEHYLAVMNTLRPPALGGDFDGGREHYEKSIALSNGADLGTKVDYAYYYARTLYDRELHDRLLNEVLEADPVRPGRTLFNVLAQRDARAMLDSADDYF
jgi:hypothetical protein